MAKKVRKQQKSILHFLFILLALSLFLFGTVLFKKNQENSDVKGDSTMSRSVDSKGVIPPEHEESNAGEACGLRVNRFCTGKLICAPLDLAGTALKEHEDKNRVMPVDDVWCSKKSQDEYMDHPCNPRIPYYGACVKTGVWPRTSNTPTPTSAPTTSETQSLVPTSTPTKPPRPTSGSTATMTPSSTPKYIPTATPVKKQEHTPTPTPPSGCNYIHVTCIQEPCGPILDCSSQKSAPVLTPFQNIVQTIRSMLGL